MRLFHGTNIDNVTSIKKSGLIAKFEGVYLTDSIDSAIRWTGIKLMHSSPFMAVIEVEVDEKKLEEGVDHSPAMVDLFGVGKSLVSPRSIPKSRIKRVHYFELTQMRKELDQTLKK